MVLNSVNLRHLVPVNETATQMADKWYVVSRPNQRSVFKMFQIKVTPHGLNYRAT